MIFAAPPPAPAPTPPRAQVSSARYGFAGSPLGETLAEWRDAKPAKISIVCATDAKRPGLESCRGADAPLGGGFLAHDLTYSFVDGRLARISFRSSIDAFDFVTADLKHRFDPPDQIVRDNIKDSRASERPHVLMRWRNGRSTIELSDPIPNATQLRVNFTLDGAAMRLSDVG